MNKERMVHLVAQVTIVTGSMTGWKSKNTRFAQTKSHVELCLIFRNEFSTTELIERLEELVNELDNDTQFCLVLENEIKVLN